jgi:hypothetical protein
MWRRGRRRKLSLQIGQETWGWRGYRSQRMEAAQEDNIIGVTAGLGGRIGANNRIPSNHQRIIEGILAKLQSEMGDRSLPGHRSKVPSVLKSSRNRWIAR